MIESQFIHNMARVKRILSSGLMFTECEANGVLTEQ